jgi:hypothetical protein
MKVFEKATIATAVVAFILAINTTTLFVAANAESSIRITQSTEDGSNSVRVSQSAKDGLEVDCEGNIKCEIMGDGRVVATSKDNNSSSTITSTSTLNQSDIIQSENALDVIDEQELSSRIMGMVNRLLDNVFA